MTRTRARARENYPCRKCAVGSTYCVDSRPSTYPGIMRRRRYMCDKCGARFTTFEMPAEEARNGRHYPAGARSMENTVRSFLTDVARSAQKHFGPGNGTTPIHPRRDRDE